MPLYKQKEEYSIGDTAITSYGVKFLFWHYIRYDDDSQDCMFLKPAKHKDGYLVRTCEDRFNMAKMVLIEKTIKWKKHGFRFV